MSGRRRFGEARAGSTKAREAHHTASSRAAAARGTRPAAAARAAGGAAAGAGAAAAAVAADGDPGGRRAWRLLTSVAAGAQAIRAALRTAVRKAADRSTRGNRLAVRRRERTVARLLAFGGGKVCGGTASSGCDGNSRAGGAGHRGTRTGWAAPADSGPVPGAAAAAGIGGWPKLVAKGSTTVSVAGGTSPAAGSGCSPVAWALTSI